MCRVTVDDDGFSEFVRANLSDLSEAATAAALGCSVGTVKSQSSRAMRALRAAPGLRPTINGESM